MLNWADFHGRFDAPKMYKDMAEKRMNEFQQVVDAEYVYAEAADGSQVRIKRVILWNCSEQNWDIHF